MGARVQPPIHLRCHSHYSHLWGTASPAALCQEATARGVAALALTDRNGLYGLVPFLREVSRGGLAAVIGVELVRGRQGIVLLAETPEGYRRLCAAVSGFHMAEPGCLTEILPPNLDGLIVLCAPGPLLERLSQACPHDTLFVEVGPRASFHAAAAAARRLGVPPMASWPVTFARPEQHEIHLLARAIAQRTTPERLSRDAVASPLEYMPTPEEFEREFATWPCALENNRVVTNRCARQWDVRALVDARGEEGAEEREELRRRCLEGARERYGAISAAVGARLERELEIIARRGFSAYFLLVERLVRDAPLRCGRGSAAGSVVSYCLGLTGVDPLAHGLLFERFLSEGRPDPPDIDIDLPWDDRHRILRAALEELGSQRAAMVATHVRMELAGAVYEVGKVAGLPPREVAKVTKRLRRHFGEARPPAHPVFQHTRLDPPWPEILAKAETLRGLPKYLSVHCGGVVTGEPSLWAKVPVQRSRAGFPVVQWDKDQVEEAGLVKIDILGNRSLSVVRDTIAEVRKQGEPVPSYRELEPLDDPATMCLMAMGDTMGVFYAESPPMRQLLAKAGRGDFRHLVIHSSIIRPAAYHYIGEYLKRLKGAPRRAWHPLAEQILHENLGLMFYQEDVMRVGMAVGGLTPVEAEQLRKTLAKKPGHAPLQRFRERFLGGGHRNGLSPEETAKLWSMVESFAGYSFCKAHSASYAMVSFKAGFLKARYPAHFMAAVLSNGGGYYSPLAYIWDARRHGAAVARPHVNESLWRYTARAKQIRVGFMQIKGIGREFARKVVGLREANGPYRSLEEFWREVAPRTDQVEKLVKAGCFDGLTRGRNRSQLLWVARALSQRSHSNQMALWSGELATPDLPPPSRRELWAQEVEAFGFPLTGTPLDPYGMVVEGLHPVPASQLAVRAGENVALAGWLLTRKQARTRRDEPMEFLSFDDGSALFEVTVFPDVWRDCVSRLQTGACYVVTGRVEEEYGVRSVTAHRVVPLASLRAAEPQRSPRSYTERGGPPVRLEPALAHLGTG